MALKLLAGPFPVRYNGVDVLLASPAWYDDVGLIGHVQVGITIYSCIAQLDGVVWLRGIRIGDWRAGHNFDTGGATALMPGTTWRQFDAFDLRLLQVKGPVAGNPIFLWHKLPDRQISIRNGRIYRESPTFAQEYQFYIGSGAAWISPARSGTLMAAFVVGSGVGHEYDHVAKAPVGWVRNFPAIAGASVDGIFYSRAFGVWITIHRIAGAQSIRIWADEVDPVTLSTPVALTPVVKGRVSSIRVQLTGADADPCIGFPVNWSLTGPGSIAPVQSITDADGFASTDYAAPPSGGSADIQAEVLF